MSKSCVLQSCSAEFIKAGPFLHYPARVEAKLLRAVDERGHTMREPVCFP